MTWLLALLLVTVVVGGTRAALRPGGVEVNHVVLLSFGIGFYWVLPLVAGTLRILGDQPGLALWYRTWDVAAVSGGLTSFIAMALVTYCAFLAGDWIGTRLPAAESREAPGPPYDPRLLWLYLLPAVALTFASAWQLRSELFEGYQYVLTPATGRRGTLSACSLLLFALYLLRSVETRRWWPDRTGWRATLLDPFLLAYCISAVLVLSLGGRLYVVSAILMVIVQHTVYRGPLRAGRTLIIVLSLTVLASVAGSLRLGATPSPILIVFNVLAEPLFTGFSLLHFIAQDNVPWIALPRFLASDFVNLIPTAILPGKAQYLLDPSDFGYSVFSPLGALSSYISLTINFGKLGTPVMLFVLGVALAVLKRRRSTLARVMYSMLTGWLAFTFFRDAFSISVVKNMFEFSILLPTLMIWFAHVMTVIAPRKERSVVMAAAARP